MSAEQKLRIDGHHSRRVTKYAKQVYDKWQAETVKGLGLRIESLKSIAKDKDRIAKFNGKIELYQFLQQIYRAGDTELMQWIQNCEKCCNPSDIDWIKRQLFVRYDKYSERETLCIAAIRTRIRYQTLGDMKNLSEYQTWFEKCDASKVFENILQLWHNDYEIYWKPIAMQEAKKEFKTFWKEYNTEWNDYFLKQIGKDWDDNFNEFQLNRIDNNLLMFKGELSPMALSYLQRGINIVSNLPCLFFPTETIGHWFARNDQWRSLRYLLSKYPNLTWVKDANNKYIWNYMKNETILKIMIWDSGIPEEQSPIIRDWTLFFEWWSNNVEKINGDFVEMIISTCKQYFKEKFEIWKKKIRQNQINLQYEQRRHTNIPLELDLYNAMLRHLACIAQEKLIELFGPILTNYVDSLNQKIRGINVNNKTLLERLPTLHEWMSQINWSQGSFKCVTCAFQNNSCTCNMHNHQKHEIERSWDSLTKKIILPMRWGEWLTCGQIFLEAVELINTIWVSDDHFGGIHLEEKNNDFYYKQWDKIHKPTLPTYSLHL